MARPPVKHLKLLKALECSSMQPTPPSALALLINVTASSFDQGAVEVLAWQMGGIFLPPSDAVTESVTDYPKPAPASHRLRHALALPVYTIALILDFASAALDRLAAWIAGDDWPR